MLDTDATVTIFDRSLSSFGDPDQTDLDRLAASLDYLALSNCKPAKDKAGQHPMAEALAEHEQLLIVAVPPASEQL